MHGLSLWRVRWMAAGLPVIPITANAKTPLFEWGSVPSSEQWQRAGGDEFRGNIAAVLGNGIAVLDADNSQAAEHISAHLAGLGISSPVVQTVSGGAHYWLRLADAPADVSYKLLSPEVGAGELRVSNCYVLVPCSAIGDKRYQFVHGSPESIATQRAVRWQDLLTLLPGTERTGERLDALPVRLIKRAMPGRAARLFEMLRDAPRSEPVDGTRYATRSEAEAAIVAILALSGWQLDDIFSVFEAEQPAHFVDAKHSRRYLELTYQNVLGDIAATPERAQLAELYGQAERWQWHGRGGLLDLAVYRAMIAAAYQFAQFTVSVSVRDIAEHASASLAGVHSAQERLSAAGLVRKMQAGDTLRASLWHIDADVASRYTNISHSINKQKEDKKSGSTERDAAEVWGAACLGRSSGAVYAVLSDTGMSIAALAKLTGKAHATARSALKTLERYHLAALREGLWYRGEAQVSAIIHDLNTESLAERRHERHEREREAWRLRLAEMAKRKQARLWRGEFRRGRYHKHGASERIFEPALRLAERAQLRAEQRWLSGGADLPCAQPVREVVHVHGIRAPEQPVICSECGGTHFEQAAPGLRWFCVDCKTGKHASRISSDITDEQVNRLMAWVNRFSAEQAKHEALYGSGITQT